MRPATRLSAFICSLGLLLPSALTHNASAAEVDLLNDGLSLSDCLDPNATVPGGFFVTDLFKQPRYGPVDQFPGARLNMLTRAGSFNPEFKFNLLRAARRQLGEARFRELAGLLRDDKVLEPEQLGLFRALSASSARARSAGDSATADALAARAAALVTGTFDAPNIIAEIGLALELQAPDRLMELLSPDFADLLTLTLTNSVSPFAIGLASNILGLKSAPGGIDRGNARLGSVLFLVGADGIRNTADDLPFFQPGKGMVVVPTGRPFSSFHPLDFTDVVTGVVDVTDVEFYGRFTEDVIVNFGCEQGAGSLGGIFDPNTGICTKDGA